MRSGLHNYLRFGSFKGVDSTLHLFILLSTFAVFMMFSLSSYLLFYKLYSAKKFTHLFGGILCSIIGVIFLRYFIEEICYRYFFGDGNYTDNTKILYYIVDNVFYGILYSLIGATHFFIQYASYSKEQSHMLEIQNKHTELSFLKAQLNPHFFFNTLNTLYSLINKKSDLALDLVSKISSLLRYSLYETDEHVFIQQELNYITDFIDVQKLRFKDPIHYDLNIEPSTLSKKIYPFMFTPFVENAFKHGELLDKDNPVRVSLKFAEGCIYFTCTNKCKQMNKDGVGGIGLTNTKKRLSLIYGDRHQLTLNEKNNFFTVELRLKVND